KFSLSANEDKIYDIAQDDIKASHDECQRSLFGKVIGDRPASWIGIKRAMSQIWKLNQPMDVKELCPNYFQFIFQNRDDMKKVAAGTNWNFENQYIILKEWMVNINSKHPCFQELNLWAQVQNIPLNWLSTDVGLKIGKAFKSLRNVVIATTGNHGGKLLRLLVIVDINEPLPRIAKIRLGDQIVSVCFQYEKLINHCHYCGIIGHLDRGCRKKMEDVTNNSVKEDQYGEWMRAADGFKWAPNGISESRNSPPTDSPAMEVHDTSHKASTSQIQSESPRVPDHEVVPSPAKSVGCSSLVSANHTLSPPRDNIKDNQLQIVESTTMDMEKEEIPRQPMTIDPLEECYPPNST
ncbi:Unknown protein, partial [Striga hermonthica]